MVPKLYWSVAQILIEKQFVAHYFLKCFVRLDMGTSNILNYGIAAVRLFRVLLDKGMAFKAFITQHHSCYAWPVQMVL